VQRDVLSLMSRGRRRAVRLLLAAVVVGHVVAFAVNREAPNHVFAYQMFDESSTWRADVVRVLEDGRRVPVEQPWNGYRWHELVPDRGLAAPGITHHADSGIETTLYLLGRALDWVAAHTPEDHETRYLQAEVTWVRNRGPLQRTILRSPARPVDR
jgi:hypothetical protein